MKKVDTFLNILYVHILNIKQKLTSTSNLESPIEHIQAVFQDSLINCRWKKIAELLGTPKACVEKLKMELILRNRRHAEILQDVFMYWRLENLANGTVKNFLEIIGNDAELKSIIGKVLYVRIS